MAAGVKQGTVTARVNRDMVMAGVSLLQALGVGLLGWRSTKSSHRWHIGRKCQKGMHLHAGKRITAECLCQLTHGRY